MIFHIAKGEEDVLLVLQKKVFWLILMMCFFCGQLVHTAAAEAADYKVRSFHSSMVEEGGERFLRLEVSLNKPSEAFRTYVNPDNPNQLIVALDRTRLRGVKKKIVLNCEEANRVEFVKADKDSSLMVITLPREAARADYEVYTQPKDRKAKKDFRIVVDLRAGEKFHFTAGLAGKRIVLDAGHGGSDPGAIGPNRLTEKEVTLDVTARVEKILKKAGANVTMTRGDDRDVYGADATDRQELQARVDVGKKADADIFLSIHANSFSSPKAHGTATYYYEKDRYDALLAQALQRGMVEYGGRYDRGIHEANFYVVKRSRMPAALVELAFISNYEEEGLLGAAKFREALAEGICKGLSNFFTQAEG